MSQAMGAIHRSAEELGEIVKVIEQIEKKTKVINEMVNKTELLSFNASVEAARAGEHGKGFAVVAEEVGKLARMSGSAAEEISSLLEESASKVKDMVQLTKSNVALGNQITKECGEVFAAVVQNVTQVSGSANEISVASEEQARGVNEINKAMAQLDQVTQQNASTSGECASAAEELSAQAESLKQTVQSLVMVIQGQRQQNQHLVDSDQPGMWKSSGSTLVESGMTQQKVWNLKPQAVSLSVSSKRKPSHPGDIEADDFKAVVPLKKAAGNPPSYHSEGFREV
jgi:uncharacterized phage infection (PIP) family protein YhgE